jgi:hypothetical protein
VLLDINYGALYSCLHCVIVCQYCLQDNVIVDAVLHHIITDKFFGRPQKHASAQSILKSVPAGEEVGLTGTLLPNCSTLVSRSASALASTFAMALVLSRA